MKIFLYAKNIDQANAAAIASNKTNRAKCKFLLRINGECV